MLRHERPQLKRSVRTTFIKKEVNPVDQHILIVTGAIRSKGNTDILVEKFIEGAASAKISTEQVDLRKKRIGDCIGCYQCMRKSICTLDDDMTQIRNQIEKCAVLLFASPLYWCGVPGRMKTFIDRLFFYYHPQNRTRIAGKKVIVLSPLNQKDVSHETAPLVEFYERLFHCLGLVPSGMHFFGGIMENNATLQKPEYLERAFSIGREMHNLL